MNTKKLILLVELSSKNHYSMFDSWLRVCDINGWDFGIVATKSVYDNLTEDVKNKSKFIHLLEDASLQNITQINRISQREKVDIVNFFSIQSNYISFAIFLTFFMKVPYIVSVHNANAWFKPRYIYKNIKYTFKSISRLFIKIRCKAFIVNSESMYNHCSKLTTRNLFTVPFSLRRSSSFNDSDSPLSIVYPGMVSVSRKRYAVFLRLAKLYPNIKFILLGKSDNNSRHIIEEANNISNVEVHDYYIPHDKYSEIMSSSSMIFTDMKVDFSSDGFDEIYGISKDSGVSYLMLEYQKKAMLNIDFNNFSLLSKDSLYFSSLDEAITILESISSDRSCLNFESAGFDVSAISKKLLNL